MESLRQAAINEFIKNMKKFDDFDFCYKTTLTAIPYRALGRIKGTCTGEYKSKDPENEIIEILNQEEDAQQLCSQIFDSWLIGRNR